MRRIHHQNGGNSLVVFGHGVRLLPSSIMAQRVIFHRCGDTRFPNHTDPYGNRYKPFIMTQSVFYDRCDKNFVYFTLHPHYYPSLKEVYLYSHPCEYSVFSRFVKSGIKVFLHEHFAGYKYRWADDMPNVSIITEDAYKRALALGANLLEELEHETYGIPTSDMSV